MKGNLIENIDCATEKHGVVIKSILCTLAIYIFCCDSAGLSNEKIAVFWVVAPCSVIEVY
jgi:hypothetical protein